MSSETKSSLYKHLAFTVLYAYCAYEFIVRLG